MAKRKSPEVITSDAGISQARKTAPALKRLLRQPHSGHHGTSSVREADHKGHHIVIKTTYDITVDGKKLKAPLSVSNAGTVEYHATPNVAYASAVDLVRAVIDQFPDEFRSTPPRRDDPDHGTHDHGSHDHGSHGHAVKRRRVTPARARRSRQR